MRGARPMLKLKESMMIRKRIDEMCSEYNTSMNVLEHQLKRLLKVRSNAERRIAQVRETLSRQKENKSSLLNILTERTQLARDKQRELRELEAARVEIVSLIAAYSHEIAEARKALSAIENQRQTEIQVIKAEEQNIEMTRPLVETLLTCREKLVEEFDQSQQKMWQQYNERFAREIEEANTIDQQRQEFLQLLARFRIDCTQNSEIAFLWNKRKEWIKAAAQIGAADINEQIQNEIRAIEQEFEFRYPGILSWKKPADKLVFESCLYFTRLQDKPVLVLPFSHVMWQKIIVKSADESFAGLRKFFHLLVRALKLDGRSLDIRNYKGQLILGVEMPVLKTLYLRFPAGTEISMACQELKLLHCRTSFNGAVETHHETTHNGEISPTNGLRLHNEKKENGVLSDSTDMEITQ